MPINQARKPPTPEEIIARQKTAAARQSNGGDLPAVAKQASPPMAAGPDNRTPAERYADEIAPSSIAGQLVKFSKEGKFLVSDTDEELSPDDDFVALVDESLAGWVRFHDDGSPPDRIQGLPYQGFVMPKRETLGDLDPATWPQGLSGQPSDPWQHQVCLVLQSVSTQALYTFSTSSVTGRRAVGNLLSHYNRMLRRDPDAYPVVRLKPSGFEHKDSRVGWVHTPSFVVYGRTPKNSAAKPDTSMAAHLNDEIPF